MFYLETERLQLVTIPLGVLRRRLVEEAFEADVPVGADVVRVTFPPEWPGDALVMFPIKILRRERNPDDVGWGCMLIDPAERVAVGTMGAKGMPDAEGTIEIGYGVNPAYWGRGYATEMCAALTGWLFRQPGVRRVTAETLTDNWASMRVLEKNGFVKVGSRVDEEDGPLFLWEKSRESA